MIKMDALIDKYIGDNFNCAEGRGMLIEANFAQAKADCAAWSNIKNISNAIKSGFCHAWVELKQKTSDLLIRSFVWIYVKN